MDAPKTVTVNWNTQYRLTVEMDPPAIDPPQGAGWYDEGTAVDVSIQSPVESEGKTFLFTRWSGDISDTAMSVQITMNGPKTAIAHYREDKAGPDISVSPRNIDFGVVRVDSSAQTTLEISNWGNVELVVSNISSDDDQFSVSPDSLTVPAGESRDVTVTFTPKTADSQSDTLTVESNDTDEPVVQVFLSSGGTPIISLPIISLSETSHDFSEVNIGDSSDWTLVVSNLGAADLVVENVTVLKLPEWLEWDDVSLPATIASGESMTVKMSFEPVYDAAVWSDEGSLSIEDTLIILSNDPVNPETRVYLQGVATRPIMVVSPAEVEFDSVWVMDTSDTLLTISNRGNALLSVKEIRSDTEAFWVEGDGSFLIHPDDSREVTVRFGPEVRGQYLGMLEIVGDDPADSTFTVSLTGRGVMGEATVVPDTLKFEDIPTETSRHDGFTIINDGDGLLVIDSLGLEDEEGVFEITGPLPEGGKYLESGESYEISIAFSPINEGDYRGSVRMFFRSTKTESQDTTLVLAGTAIEVDLEPIPDRLDFDDVLVGTADTLALGLHNKSDTPLTIKSVQVIGREGIFSVIDTLDGVGCSPGDTVFTRIAFHPTSRDVFPYALFVRYSRTGFQLDVEGRGVQGVLDTEADPIGQVHKGHSDTSWVKLKNTGDADLLIDSVAVGRSSERGIFNLSLLDILHDITLGPDQEAPLRMVSEFVDTGTDSAHLTVYYRLHPDTQDQNVSLLMGTGIDLIVKPDPASVPKGDSLHFTVTQIADEESDITRQVIWQSSNPLVATIDATGNAVGMRAGDTTTITAQKTKDGKTFEASTILGVTEAVLRSITLEPADVAIPFRDTTLSEVFDVTYWYTDGPRKDPPPEVQWGSSDGSIVTIVEADAIAPQRAGTVTITASAKGETGTVEGRATLTISLGLVPPDLSGDGQVDGNDLPAFTVAWNTQDLRADFGPAVGMPPEIEYRPDGRIDFEDVAVFVMWWNWYADQNRGKPVRPVSASLDAGHRMRWNEGIPPLLPHGEIVPLTLRLPDQSSVMVLHLEWTFDPERLIWHGAAPLKSLKDHADHVLVLSGMDGAKGHGVVDIARLGGEPFGADGFHPLLQVFWSARTELSDEPLAVYCRAWDGQGVMRISERGVLSLNSGPPLPHAHALHPACPNPFNPQTVIRYDLPEAGEIRLVLYDMLGRVVRYLVTERKEGGVHRARWDGTDDAGREVASGVYLCRMTTGDYAAVQKVVLIR